jgi:hypothetical protein
LILTLIKTREAVPQGPNYKLMINNLLSSVWSFIAYIFIFIIVYIFIIYSIYYIILYYNRFYYFIKRIPVINVEGFITKPGGSIADYYIFRNAYTSRSEESYKCMLEAILLFLGDIYPNQQFTILRMFTEVGSNKLHKLISDPCFFKFNVADPMSANELFNIIKWSECAFIKNNKDVVATIKII